jgi:hypothetical protein
MFIRFTKNKTLIFIFLILLINVTHQSTISFEMNYYYSGKYYWNVKIKKSLSPKATLYLQNSTCYEANKNGKVTEYEKFTCNSDSKQLVRRFYSVR